MPVKTLVDQAIAGIEAGKTEIRPGLSNALYLLRRLAPGIPFGQMAKMVSGAKQGNRGDVLNPCQARRKKNPKDGTTLGYTVMAATRSVLEYCHGIDLPPGCCPLLRLSLL